MKNPYAELRALLDVTRQIDPEEMAELHLEQGFFDRALAIYEALLEKDPGNTSWQTKRAWLARMKPERESCERVIDMVAKPAPIAKREPTLYGVPAPQRMADVRKIVRVK